MASVDTSRVKISICRFPKLSDQSESVFHLSLVFYWLMVLPFPVFKGNERCSRYTLRILGRWVASHFRITNAAGNIRRCWYDWSAELVIFFITVHLQYIVFPSAFGRWQVKILIQLVLTLAVSLSKVWIGKQFVRVAKEYQRSIKNTRVIYFF